MRTCGRGLARQPLTLSASHRSGNLRRATPLAISYTYASWAVRDCSSHWVLRGNPSTGTLIWTEGRMRPEDGIFIDFMQAVERHRTNVAAAK